MKLYLFIFIFIISINLASASLEITCFYNDSEQGITGGTKIWTSQNLTQEQKEDVRNVMGSNEVLVDCKLSEELSDITKLQECNYVVATLNNNMKGKNEEIESLKKYKAYKTWAWIMTLALLVLIIINIYPKKLNKQKNKND